MTTLSSPGQTRASLWISVVVISHSILILFIFYFHQGSGGTPMLIAPWFTISVLAGIMIAALLAIQRSGQSRYDSLVSELEQTRVALAQTKATCEERSEKKELEITVINASLNREIAERMQTEAHAKKLRKQFELILNSAGEGIIGLDTDGNFMFVNTAAALMVGYEPAELIGKSHHELIHHSKPDGSPLDTGECLIQQAYRDGVVHSSSTDVFWTRDGASFPVEYVSTPITENGDIRGAVMVFRDLSAFEP
jgi:PAS domain S-box-containing protein